MIDCIDSAHHLYDLSSSPDAYPALRGPLRKTAFGTDEGLRQDYRLEQYQADMQAMCAVASVHVEAGRSPGDPVEESAWLSSLADRAGVPSAFVARVDLMRDDAQQQLERHVAFARVRGVRQILGNSGSLRTLQPQDSLFAQPRWRQGVGLLAGFNLCCELQAPPTVAALAAEVVREHPQVQFVLTHGGHPIDRSADALDLWRVGLDAMARCANITVKLSGFYMMHPQETPHGMRDIVVQIIDRFGPQRCMFGSNFPVDRLFVAAADLRANFDAAIGRYSAEERAAILVGTARRVYRIPST